VPLIYRTCTGCGKQTLQRTLYAFVTVNGKRRWLPTFYACTGCLKVNRISRHAYRRSPELGNTPDAEKGPPKYPYLPAMLELLLEERTGEDVIDKLGRLGYNASDHEIRNVLDFLASMGVLSKREIDYTGGVLSMIKPGGRRLRCEKCGRKCIVRLYAKNDGRTLAWAGNVCACCYAVRLVDEKIRNSGRDTVDEANHG